MNEKNKESAKKSENIRVSKNDRKNIEGQTNWAYLITEERKEGNRK